MDGRGQCSLIMADAIHLVRPSGGCECERGEVRRCRTTLSAAFVNREDAMERDAYCVSMYSRVFLECHRCLVV